MLSKVSIWVKGEKKDDYINPENFVYAEENPAKDSYQPCIKLYPKKTVLYGNTSPEKVKEQEERMGAKNLYMTLQELGLVDGFVYINCVVISSGKQYSLSISKSAIISARKYERKFADQQMYVIYIVGYFMNSMPVYTLDDISVLLPQ